MSQIKVSPKDSIVQANGQTGAIQFPSLSEWSAVDAKVARAKGVDRVASVDFEERIAAFQRGEIVDLAGGGQIRIGCGFGLVLNRRPVLVKFSPTHPTRANELSPAAGLFGDESIEETPGETAIRELSEEIIARKGELILPWRVEDISYPERAKEFAELHGLSLDQAIVVHPTTSEWHTKVSFGDIAYYALVEFEADTSSLELILTGEAKEEGVELFDGERFPDGVWRESEIVTEKYESYPQTTKAKTFLAAAFKTGLVRVN